MDEKQEILTPEYFEKNFEEKKIYENITKFLRIFNDKYGLKIWISTIYSVK